MLPSSKQFTWKNRDTAAHDMLQLVYHAPPYISLLAARLLVAFRSMQILPQLTNLILDENLNGWLRIYALRAYSATPANKLAKEFEELARAALLQREQNLEITDVRSNSRGILQIDLLNELSTLADNHPANRTWFFQAIDEAHPLVQRQYLGIDALRHHHSEKFKQIVVQQLFKLLDSQPDLLDFDIIATLLATTEEAQSWLNDRLDTVVQMCLRDKDNPIIKHVSRRWPQLNELLAHHISDWDEVPSHDTNQRRRADQLEYKSSPAYLQLMRLYDKAAKSDQNAYNQLVEMARSWRGNIPIRAVATHLIGKLSEQFDAFPILAHQMRYGDVNWDDNLFDSPIRHEAGEALLKFPTPEIWEVLVDSYFISPRDDLLPFQIDWIAHLTEVLSGEDQPYDGLSWGSEERRAWFQALNTVKPPDLDSL